MNRHCRNNEELSAYLDGELDRASRLALETHLESCGACKDMLRDLHCLRACFQTLPQQETGFDLMPGLLAELDRRAPPARRPHFDLWQWLPVSFAAAATLTLGVFLGASLTGRPDAGVTVPTLAMFDPITPGGVCIGFAGCYTKEKI